MYYNILSSATIFTIILCTLPIKLKSKVAPPTLNFTLLLLLLFLLILSIVCQTVYDFCLMDVLFGAHHACRKQTEMPL